MLQNVANNNICKEFGIMDQQSEDKKCCFGKFFNQETKQKFAEVKDKVTQEAKETFDFVKQPGRFGQMLRGELDLRKTFWVYWALLSLVGFFIIIPIISALSVNLGQLLNFLLIVYNAMCLFGVWRSATKYEAEGGNVAFALAAKLSVSVFIGLQAVTFLAIILVNLLR